MSNRDSNGCIALENGNIDQLSALVSIKRTPILIVQEIKYSNPEHVQSQKEIIFRVLNKWKQALVGGNYHDYLKAYSEMYVPDISWWTIWEQFRNELKKTQNRSVSTQISNVTAIRTGSTVTLLFDFSIAIENEVRSVGTKKMRFLKEKSGYKIVWDAYSDAPPERDFLQEEIEHPLIVTMSNFLESMDKTDKKTLALLKEQEQVKIQELINAWEKAWEKGDFSTYEKCYSNQFYSQGMGKALWVSKKKRLNKLYQYIDVKLSDIQIDVNKNRAVAKFNQEYKSSGFEAVGMKRLVFMQEDSQWKIIQEIWKKS